MNGYEGRPTRSQLDQVDVLAERLDQGVAKLGSFEKGGISEINKALTARKLEPVVIPSEEEWRKKAQ